MAVRKFEKSAPVARGSSRPSNLCERSRNFDDAAPTPFCGVSNYSNDAGGGSDALSNLGNGQNWRSVLLGTVAAGAMLVGYGRSARANCVGPTPTLTCTGVISGTAAPGVVNGGILVPGGYSTVDVNSLMASIAPGYGISGIKFTSGGPVTVNSDTTGTTGIFASGTNAMGIWAESSGGGAVTVSSTGDISATGFNAHGIHAFVTGDGALEVTSTGDIAMTGGSTFGHGLAVGGYGNGTVTVNTTGSISTTGNTAHGIFARSSGGGAVTVTSTGDISTSGAFANGIDAFSNVGSLVVKSSGNITTTAGTRGYGIWARSFGSGGVTVTSSGSVSTEGYGAHAIFARNYGNGAVEVTSLNNITTTGTVSFGIVAQQLGSGAGTVTVKSTGDISTAGNYSLGIVARSNGDAVLVTSTGNITTTGHSADGIWGYNFGSGAVTVGSTGNITSTNSRGLFAYNSGAGAVSVTNDGAIQAKYNGIESRSSTGSVTVDSTGDITSSNSFGIFAENSGSETVAISSDGAIVSNFAGIHAYSSSGNVTVDASGSITATSSNIYARGITARSFGSGTSTVTNDADIKAWLQGIYATSISGGIAVTNTGDVTSLTSRAISLNGGGAGPLAVTSVGTLNARDEGIIAVSGSGSISVDSTGDITSTNARGIYAISTGASAVSVTSVGGLNGIQATSDGIRAFSSTGGVTVNNTGDIKSTYGRGILAHNYGSEAVTVTSVGGVNGIYGKFDGIFARSSSGAVNVDSTGAITSPSRWGIFAANYGANAVSVTNDGTIQAAYDGIFARSSTGAVTVDSTRDITSTNSRGIIAYNSGAGAVSVTIVGGTNGIQAALDGIFASSSSGAVTIDSTGNVSAGQWGIGARSYGANPMSVTSEGNINAVSEAIDVAASSGAVTVDSVGDLTSQTRSAIVARNGGSNAVSVTSAGTVQARYTGVYAASATGAVTVDSTGDITTAVYRGIWAMNFGAGAVSVTSVGGINGIQALSDGIYARSSTGTVTVDSTGDITSSNAFGIYAFNFGSNDVAVTSNGDIQAQFDGIKAFTSSGSVTIDTTGDITTTAWSGIAADNWGGGAGNVSITSKGSIQANAFGIYARSFASGDITVDSTGDVTSAAGTFNGIDARHFGTGDVSVTSRGNVSAPVSAIFANSSGPGAVTVDTTGNLQAAFDGIFAKSASGSVTVESTGDITSAALDAIHVQSGSTIDVTLHGGNVFGANDGVEFIDGSANTLRNFASISGASLAVRGGTGSEAIDNYNLISGNVDLGTGTNTFSNHAGGTFRSGSSVNLGVGNTLSNEGNLTPGGSGAVQTTALIGNLVQTGTGTFTVDIDESGAGADLLTINGTANFAGEVAPNVINLSSASGSYVIADATGGAASSANAVDTSAVDFYVSVLGGTQLVLHWQPLSIFDLLAGPLTPNQTNVAHYVDTLTTSGPSVELQALIFALKGLPEEEIVAALDRLHGEHYLSQVNDTLHSSLFFLNSLMSCPTAEGVAVEGECYWAKVGGRTFDWDRKQTNIGGDEEAWNVSGGAQVALDPTWRLGVALSYEDVNISTNNAAWSDGDRLEGGVILKNRWGDTTLAAAAFGGYGWFDTTRTIGFGGIDAAKGENDIAFGGVHTRLSHVFDQSGWYVKPMLDVNATYLDYGGLHETGGGAANLSVQGEQEWVFSAAPALEIGGDYRDARGTVYRPYVRIGGTIFSDTNFALTSSFLSAPTGVAPFTINSEFDELFLDVSAGLDVISIDGLNVKLNYDGSFSEDVEMHSAGVKVGVRF